MVGDILSYERDTWEEEKQFEADLNLSVCCGLKDKNEKKAREVLDGIL